MKRAIVKPAAVLAAAVSSAAVLADTRTWTGGGGDANWSTAANWDGAVPGDGDTAVFGAAVKDATVDAAKVKGLVITADYTGTLTLANDFTVADYYCQSNGTFTCGANTFTIGQGNGSSGANYRGFFHLVGGTFNCSTGVTQWKPTNNGPQFVIDAAATWNHNNGEFAVGGPNNGNACLTANAVFYNLRFISRHRPVFAGGTTNRVLGSLTSHGVGVNSTKAQSSQVSDPSAWSKTGSGKNATLAVEGDLYFDNADNITKSESRWGGTGVILMCGAGDQVIHSDGGHLPSLVVNKPGNAKVTCDVAGGEPLVFYGIGSGMNPHFFVQSGTFVFPDAGLSFPNARYSDLFQTGGRLENTAGGLSLSVINDSYLYLSNSIGRLEFSGRISTSERLSITGDVEIASGGCFRCFYDSARGEYGSPVMSGDGDQHFRAAGTNSITETGSVWYGRFKVGKSGGRLFLDTPLCAKYITFTSDAHLVFPVTNATTAVTGRGAGGWNVPVVRVSERVLELGGSKIVLEPSGRITDESPVKWNVFEWGSGMTGYDEGNIGFRMPAGCVKPKLVADSAEKIVYLSYGLGGGFMYFLR
ncbi:MAG: hypothetical protein J6T01_06860 [Kiritimatiellae bacterium]|nr:hypothetical protein [Kiritimatiellia bacterium]